MSTTRTPAFHIGDRVIASRPCEQCTRIPRYLADLPCKCGGPGEVVGFNERGAPIVALDDSMEPSFAFPAENLRREPTV